MAGFLWDEGGKRKQTVYGWMDGWMVRWRSGYGIHISRARLELAVTLRAEHAIWVGGIEHWPGR